jgi:hypothetical protein
MCFVSVRSVKRLSVVRVVRGRSLLHDILSCQSHCGHRRPLVPRPAIQRVRAADVRTVHRGDKQVLVLRGCGLEWNRVWVLCSGESERECVVCDVRDGTQGVNMCTHNNSVTTTAGCDAEAAASVTVCNVLSCRQVCVRTRVDDLQMRDQCNNGAVLNPSCGWCGDGADGSACARSHAVLCDAACDRRLLGRASVHRWRGAVRRLEHLSATNRLVR